jgi:hypothetical protein
MARPLERCAVFFLDMIVVRTTSSLQAETAPRRPCTNVIDGVSDRPASAGSNACTVWPDGHVAAIVFSLTNGRRIVRPQ